MLASVRQLRARNIGGNGRACRVVVRIYAPGQRSAVSSIPAGVCRIEVRADRPVNVLCRCRTTILRVIVPGEVISYLEMCREEGVNLQRGMNFGSSGRPSVILMSRRPGAPYDDRVEDDGRVLIYEGHATDPGWAGPKDARPA
jgi:hypothetical protein